MTASTSAIASAVVRNAQPACVRPTMAVDRGEDGPGAAERRRMICWMLPDLYPYRPPGVQHRVRWGLVLPVRGIRDVDRRCVLGWPRW